MWGVVVLFFIGFAAAEPQLSVEKGSRITGGWKADEGQFPYMIFVRGVSAWGDVTGCGGSIVHARWGLTSAKCVANRVTLLISGGSSSLSRPTFVVETSTYQTAPQFMDHTPISQPHDIALIGFNTDLTFNANVQPIRVQRSVDASRDYSGVQMTTSGWGTTYTPELYEYYEMSEDLHWTHLSGVGNFICMLMINSNWLVQETTVCAGPYNGPGQSICSGDSGVPLVTTDYDGKPTQIGVGSFVASWGCEAGFPSGFVRPGFYHEWMRQYTGVDFDWV